MLIDSAISDGTSPRFLPAELDSFREHGFVIARKLASDDLVSAMRARVQADMINRQEPAEFEADLNYPGAPDSREATGGSTIRRLLQAHGRGPEFTQWLIFPGLVDRLRQLLGASVVMPLAHHNCIMTKHPRFSSDTGWHQDIRYWSFASPELVSVWLALGDETPGNGCLRLIPGSHRADYAPEQFDDRKFFRDDLARNKSEIARCMMAELRAGDVLFFHCQTLHSATRNLSDDVKLSVVFTFRGQGNPPTPDSRSASLPEMLLTGDSDRILVQQETQP